MHIVLDSGMCCFIPPPPHLDIDSVNITYVCVGVCECELTTKHHLDSALYRELDGERTQDALRSAHRTERVSF